MLLAITLFVIGRLTWGYLDCGGELFGPDDSDLDDGCVRSRAYVLWLVSTCVAVAPLVVVGLRRLRHRQRG